VLAVFTGIQVWAFIASERAGITVEVADQAAKVASDNKPFVIRLTVKNGGHSTAMISEFSANGKFVADRLPNDPVYYRGARGAIGPILPNESAFASERPFFMEGPGKGSPVVITPELIEQITAHKLKYFLYGFVEYGDDFTMANWHGPLGKRITGFCWVYEPDNDPAFGMWNACGDANYTYAH